MRSSPLGFGRRVWDAVAAWPGVFPGPRERVFALYDAGDAVGEIAGGLPVSVSYVSKALSRRRDTGETSLRPQRCHAPPKLSGLLGCDPG